MSMMPLAIKRYRNRKLYSTVSKRYVTLGEIRELICSGKDITVTDLTSGEDITTSILTQVIMDQGRIGRGILPQGVLVELIRSCDEAQVSFRNLLPSLPGLREYLHALNIPTKEDIKLLTEKLEILKLAVDDLALDKTEDGKA